jgi:hypothetical protein
VSTTITRYLRPTRLVAGAAVALTLALSAGSAAQAAPSHAAKLPASAAQQHRAHAHKPSAKERKRMRKAMKRMRQPHSRGVGKAVNQWSCGFYDNNYTYICDITVLDDDYGFVTWVATSRWTGYGYSDYAYDWHVGL